MNRRHFLSTLAAGTAVAPQLGEIIARASAPIPARGLMFVDFADIETKALDLDMLFELMHELKRARDARGDSEYIEIYEYRASG